MAMLGRRVSFPALRRSTPSSDLNSTFHETSAVSKPRHRLYGPAFAASVASNVAELLQAQLTETLCQHADDMLARHNKNIMRHLDEVLGSDDALLGKKPMPMQLASQDEVSTRDSEKSNERLSDRCFQKRSHFMQGKFVHKTLSGGNSNVRLELDADVESLPGLPVPIPEGERPPIDDSDWPHHEFLEQSQASADISSPRMGRICSVRSTASVISYVSAHTEARDPCEPQEGFYHIRDQMVDEVLGLRLARESDLLQELQRDDNSASPPKSNSSRLRSVHEPDHSESVASPLLHRICGILPWKEGGHIVTAYHYAVLTLALAAVIACLENMFTLQLAALAVAESYPWEGARAEPGEPLHLCSQEIVDLLVAIGSLLGFLATRRLSSCNLLGNSRALLVRYARRERLLSAWSWVSVRQGVVLLLTWVLVVAARAMVEPHYPSSVFVAPARKRASLAIFAFSSGLFLVLVHCVLHVVVLLLMTVDAFCFHFVHRASLDDNVRDWDQLQAMLRRASRAVELPFVVLQTASLMAVLVAVTAMAVSQEPVMHIWLLLAAVLLGLVAAWLFSQAAEVTEKCARVPSLVNSLSFGMNVDARRHFLVEYISYSLAGFYVKEVRVTATTAIKLTYIGGLVVFGLVTKVANAW